MLLLLSNAVCMCVWRGGGGGGGGEGVGLFQQNHKQLIFDKPNVTSF